MRVLMINSSFPNAHNWGHQHFREEFAKHSDTFFYGGGYGVEGFSRNTPIDIVEEEYGPFDLVVTGMCKYCRYWLGNKGMNRLKAKKAHIIVDYHPDKSWDTFHDGMFGHHAYDALFARTLYEYDYVKSRRPEIVFYLPYAVNSDIYTDPGIERIYDVMAVWSWGKGYPNRIPVQRQLRALGVSNVTGRVIQHAYVKHLQRSKIFVGSVNKFKTLTMKVSEAMACGCLYMTDKPSDLEKQGYVDGEHLVLYEGLADLREKVLHYLQYDAERKRIAQAGKEFVLANHTNAIRVQQFLKMMETVS